MAGDATYAIQRPRPRYSLKHMLKNQSSVLFFLVTIMLSSIAMSQTNTTEKPRSTEGAIATIKDCDVCPELIAIPAGSFIRGSKDGRSTEQPVHQVNVGRFLIGRFEVTQGQWKSVMGDTPSTNQSCGNDCPVESVSWNDVQLYLKKLSESSGKVYRLPSEAEWEYAARAGTTSVYWWGDIASHDQANFGSEECCSGLVEARDQWDGISPVGRFLPNAFGLYDTQGNVAEWVEDVYHRNYFLAPGDGSAWIAGTPPERLARVVRGGAWNHDSNSIRSASRGKAIVTEPSDAIGFRVARSL